MKDKIRMNYAIYDQLSTEHQKELLDRTSHTLSGSFDKDGLFADTSWLIFYLKGGDK